MVPIVDGADEPERRGPWRYLWWLVVRQRGRAATGALFGSVGMVGLALPPYVLSRAIDDGLAAGDPARTVAWSGVLLVVGVFNAWVGIMRHRTMTKVRMDATFRTIRAVVWQAMRLGVSLRRQVAAGEVATIGLSDVQRISQTLTIVGPGVGAVIAYGVIAGLLLSVSPLLAVVVLLGVPLLAVLVGPLLARLHGAEVAYREHHSELTARLGDIVGGLRVLNGIGGAGYLARRYRRRSQELVAEGYRVGAVTSWITAMGTGLPVVFLAAVTWLAARMTATGAITVGELVAIYGYVAVLVVPVSFFIEGGYDLSRGLVAAGRVTRFLALNPDIPIPPTPAETPESSAVLKDPESGVEIAPGRLTALVSASSVDTAAVVDRLGGLVESSATWGCRPLRELSPPEVRERILVADNDADLFAGSVREVVSGRHDQHDAAIADAVHAAMADDVVDALPGGFDAGIEAQGRNLSGGQRQRIRLVRALLSASDVLIAIDPTSALDSPTEAIVAARLRSARAGSSTVVTTTSAVLLDHADVVQFLVDGRVAATGRHRDLLAEHPEYRRLVTRGAEEDPERDDLTDPRRGTEAVP